jgi:hypothetical protein
LQNDSLHAATVFPVSRLNCGAAQKEVQKIKHELSVVLISHQAIESAAHHPPPHLLRAQSSMMLHSATSKRTIMLHHVRSNCITKSSTEATVLFVTKTIHCTADICDLSFELS